MFFLPSGERNCYLVNRVGVEPTTVGLKGHRSTTELPIHVHWLGEQDSNLHRSEPKSDALPLYHLPKSLAGKAGLEPALTAFKVRDTTNYAISQCL